MLPPGAVQVVPVAKLLLEVKFVNDAVYRILRWAQQISYEMILKRKFRS